MAYNEPKVTSTGGSVSVTYGTNNVNLEVAGGSTSILTITGNSGGAETPSAGNFNILGTGSITVAGSANTETAQLTGLTNHAVLVGAGTATITKVGPTATAGQVLQSAGSSADPAFSTATYPLTTTINQVLYSSSNNTVSEITAANNGTLITSSSGVPSLLANGTTGQVLTATTGSPPSWQAAAVQSGTGSGIYGDRSDGTVTFDGSTTILGMVPSSSTYTLTRDFWFTAATINNGVSIITNGFRISVDGALTNNGTIKWNGNNAVTVTPGAELSNSSASLNSNTTTGGAANVPGTAGGAPGVIGVNQGTFPTLGGAGGAGGASSGSGSGGGHAGGTVTSPSSNSTLPRNAALLGSGFLIVENNGPPTFTSFGGGAGGGGGDGGTGGAGGGGGGVIVILAKTFAGTGTISANGGNGSNFTSGSSQGGGGGGGGGFIGILSQSVVAAAISGQTITVTGGSGGTGNGGKAGASGSAGTIILVPDN